MKKPQRKTFRSDFEYHVAIDLWERGVDFTYEEEELPVLLPVYRGRCHTCGGTHVYSKRTYTPDFKIEGRFFVETKGKFVPQNRTRMEAVFESNKEVDVRMLFMRNNYLTKKKAGTYGDWCDKHNIKWAVGRLPQEWLDE